MHHLDGSASLSAASISECCFRKKFLVHAANAEAESYLTARTKWNHLLTSTAPGDGFMAQVQDEGAQRVSRRQ